MALPTSRDYDATDAGPLTHTTVNNLQDAIVRGSHGSITVGISPLTMLADGISVSYSITTGASSYYTLTDGIGYVAVPVVSGTVVSSFSVYGNKPSGAHSANAYFTAINSDATTASSTLGTRVEDSTDFTITGAPGVTISSGGSAYIKVTSGGGHTNRVYGITVTYYIP